MSVTSSFSRTRSTTFPATVWTKEAVGELFINLFAPVANVSSVVFFARSVSLARKFKQFFVKVNACVWLRKVKDKIVNMLMIFFMCSR